MPILQEQKSVTRLSREKTVFRGAHVYNPATHHSREHSMAQQLPVIKTDPLYILLREGNIKAFNERKAKGEKADLIGADFQRVDLRGIDADGLDLSNCYFRTCDLRGLNLTKAKLEGASIHGAQISGTYFPPQLDPEEITLSFLHGTRMRYK